MILRALLLRKINDASEFYLKKCKIINKIL